MTKNELKKQVCDAIEVAAKDIEELACTIESEPELGFKEANSSMKDTLMILIYP